MKPASHSKCPGVFIGANREKQWDSKEWNRENREEW